MVSSPGVRPIDADPILRYEVSADESLSDAVLRAAGEVLDDLTSVRPLSSIVDVESIDLLFERRRSDDVKSGVVTFVAWDLWFVVTAAAIEIYETDDPLDD